ncbi:DUF4124 domain-containing protein [Massilia sp. YIM B04103]|uniref:DUF4124 domain-containing protein n=1 Tax=Massilia sp. YIM B04103 TaxID=2963106 RepID=UPI00210882D6|nr:DUF4124 domain-containing protein [Massilia sp. YIM B04103]
MKRLFCVLAGLCLAAQVSAQTMHKCVVDGKVTYTEAPCADGRGTTLAAPPVPPPDPQAKTELKRQQRELKQLQKERKQREARDEADLQRHDRHAAERRKRCDRLALDKKWADEDARAAVGSNADKARQRAQRTGEKLALECPH